MLNGLSLFSGIGGIDVALSEYVRPLAYCEIDPYCQAVLLSRMASNDIENAPIWDDITTLEGSQFKGKCDIIYGGFPCQDISIAGKGKGLEGERSGLFFEIVRLAKEIKPKFLFLENTKGILSNGGIEVIKTLATIWFSSRWITKSCKEVGSPQNRERWFCLAYCNSIASREADTRSQPFMFNEKTRVQSSRQNRAEISRTYWEKNKCPFLGMDYDFPFELDRAFSLGNSVCVEQTREAFKELMGSKK